MNGPTVPDVTKRQLADDFFADGKLASLIGITAPEASSGQHQVNSNTHSRIVAQHARTTTMLFEELRKEF